MSTRRQPKLRLPLARPNYARHYLSWKRVSEQKEREPVPRQRSNTKLRKSANTRRLRNPQPPNSLEPYEPGRTPGDVELEAEKTRKRRDQRAFGGEVTGAEVEGRRNHCQTFFRTFKLVLPSES
ncbi:uncharacterized protein LOC130135305 [Syzygium oleosum]|uniref:uncharacterized protein LOC130135305 n=1 Tax=Syzygium oleosum TaxID=219896 RepID=UPI0024BA6F10|nr:uncharacterized protein LOC130135305 [Syzygium oleosum]